MSATTASNPRSTTLLEKEFGGVASLARLYTAQVSGHQRWSSGSGVVWRHDGLVVTTSTVARDSRVVVSLHDESVAEGRVVARDEASGLALLWVPARGLLIAPPGDPWALKAGSVVLALGRAVGSVRDVSLGLVHSVTRDSDGDPHWLASDIALSPHSVGGALVDASARLIGINAATVAGLSTAIPVNVVHEFVREAEEDGRIRKRALWAA
jgi:S1-C subfamily serine protease